jgi:hypothetical protein
MPLRQACRGLRAAGLGDAAVAGGAHSGLADLGVQSQVADELVGAREPAEVLDRGEDGQRHDRVDPRHGHEASDHRIVQRLDCELGVDRFELVAVEVELTDERRHAPALVGGQLLGGQPVPTGLAEQVRHQARRRQLPSEDRVHLVLQPGALADQVGPSGDLAAQHAGAVIGQPHRRQEVRCKQPGQDPGVDLVSLHLRLGDRPGLARFDTTTRHTSGPSSKAMASLFPVGSKATSSTGSRVSAHARSASGVTPIRPSSRHRRPQRQPPGQRRQR